MGKRIIHRQYLRLVGVALGALILGLVSGFALHAWNTSFIMLGCIVLYCAYLAGMIYLTDKRGEYVSVYGICDEAEKHKHKIAIPGRKKMITYRFCVRDKDDDVSYIFITAEAKKFRCGEAYCLVFHSQPDGSFSAGNLLGAECVPPEVVLYDAEANVLEDKACPNMSPLPDDTIEFPKKEG